LIKNETVNALRFLSADSVERASSGHPGMPLGMADIAEVLWREHLHHSPTNSNWFNRDRFVLSNGHGSMLLYSLLHLTGYKLSLDDLKDFRQLKSKTPGHPEYGITDGVETTTGPLGQGLANAIGMALAEKILASKINTNKLKPIDHKTYCFIGDGCLMEGISHEVMSLAGVLELNKLICFYDSNGISIDGEIKDWYKDDIRLRCESYGWNVIGEIDGHNRDQINEAIIAAKESNKPTMIVCKTSIGYGAGSKQDSESSHGAPLGEDALNELRENLKWSYGPFEIPESVYEDWDFKEKGKILENNWKEICEEHEKEDLEKARLLKRLASGDLPEGFFQAFNNHIVDLQENTDSVATRKCSQIVLEFLKEQLPELVGGSADLSGSNNTITKLSTAINSDPSGNYIYYGVREFGMNAIMNGMSLHGGIIPFGGTFLVFMDYGRNAVRMSALMGIRTIYVFSHDSVALGEDGPTHQPIEHLNTLRSTPNMHTWRPATLVETAVSWKKALENKNGPTSIILSRQNLNNFSVESVLEVEKGGYFVKYSADAKINLIATGSEVSTAIESSEILKENGLTTNIASVPCLEELEKHESIYKKIFSQDSINIVIECSHPNSWYKHTKNVIGIDTFGESGKGNQLMDHFGFTPSKIAKKISELV
tara:strand:+ start:2194 stop:4155 length:1962 start_codon:yes stop_codon:yes gene_type:complete